MANFATEPIVAQPDVRLYFQRVYLWMAVGLALTAGVGWWIDQSDIALNILFGGHGRTIVLLCFGVEFALVLGLTGLLKHMSVWEAGALFLVFAAVNGVTFSIVFLVYTTSTIFSSFVVTAAMYVALALWGFVTKRDLSRWGTFLFTALCGLLIALFVSFFWENSTLYWATTAAGVLIFSAYTAFDVQKLKQYAVAGDPDSEAVEKSAIFGALALYLDFVNLFLYVLRAMGRRK